MVPDQEDLKDFHERIAAASREISEVLSAGEVRESTGLPEHLQFLQEKNQWQQMEIDRLRDAQERQLKRTYAKGILWMLSVQLTLANAVFIVYAWRGRHWHLDTEVIDVWLAATVVQVVGIVLVVTRHLFPNRDGVTATS